jgi:hypothetical protein
MNVSRASGLSTAAILPPRERLPGMPRPYRAGFQPAGRASRCQNH